MDVDLWLQKLRAGKILSERDIKNLCIQVTEIFSEVPSIFNL